MAVGSIYSTSCLIAIRSSPSDVRSTVRRIPPVRSSLRPLRVPVDPRPSPLHVLEREIASLFAHARRVQQLERLFGDSGPLQFSGPDKPPSPIAGSSGRPIRVAYQGVPGSYCQEAALKAFPSSCNTFPCNQMEEAFQALEDHTVDRAIIPVENSVDGSIARNFDLLLRHNEVRIIGEHILPVNHCLLAVPGACKSQLKRIASHPQALSHCNIKLHSLHDVEIVEVGNAADAARHLSEHRIFDMAVIGSKIAAREFGLRVLEENLQDEAGNFTRFLQLSAMTGAEPPPAVAAGPWTTTVAFSLKNGVSDLCRALEVFDRGGVGVTRVEHRPNRSQPVRVVGGRGYLDYVFILDFQGSVRDSPTLRALAELKAISGGHVSILGSYTCGIER